VAREISLGVYGDVYERVLEMFLLLRAVLEMSLEMFLQVSCKQCLANFLFFSTTILEMSLSREECLAMSLWRCLFRDISLETSL